MNRPYRIAHVDTERTWRGGENQVLLLMKGLRSKGHTNVAVVRPDTPLAERASNEGFQIRNTTPWGEWDFVSAHFLNRWLKSQKIDLIHAHSGHAVSLAVMAALGTKIPVVATRRVDFPLSKNVFSRFKYGRLKTIIAISDGVRQVLTDSGIPPEKIERVWSGIDFAAHQSVSPAPASELGVPEGVKIIGQIAALAPHKDQATFISALAILRKKDPSIHGVIVGDGELRPALEAQAEKLGIRSALHLVGFKKDPLRFAAAFHVFCLSSKEEGLGTSLIDAMALRIPVAATRAGGIPDLIEDGVTGFLATPRSPESLAEALEKALSIRSRDPGLIERAYSRAREFDIQSTVLGTESVYSRILSDNL
jgi:glycosyltransferase involved in cell wall biosynthesis